MLQKAVHSTSSDSDKYMNTKLCKAVKQQDIISDSESFWAADQVKSEKIL